MKKIFAMAAVALSIFCFQINTTDAGVKGTVWRCKWCKQEIKMPPYEYPGDYSQYKGGCSRASFGDRHKWIAVGYYFSDGSIKYIE